jgi:hypothetical protein
MDDTDPHDRAVQSLTEAFRAFFASAQAWTVLPSARWQPLPDFPNCVYSFDVLLVPSEANLEWDAARNCFGPGVQPVTVFDIIRKEDYEEEFYDKPDILLQAGVSEYCLWDPTARWLRPPFQAWRIRESALRPVRTCSRGVFFSIAGFRLEARGTEVELTPCGEHRVEEELFTCQRLLDEARSRAAGEEGRIDGLFAKVDRLRAQLGRRDP